MKVKNGWDEVYLGMDGGQPVMIEALAEAEVSDEKAAQLLADFPARFTAVTPPKPAEPKTKASSKHSPR